MKELSHWRLWKANKRGAYGLGNVPLSQRVTFQGEGLVYFSVFKGFAINSQSLKEQFETDTDCDAPRAHRRYLTKCKFRNFALLGIVLHLQHRLLLRLLTLAMFSGTKPRTPIKLHKKPFWRNRSAALRRNKISQLG